jgi:hypothetical protein
VKAHCLIRDQPVYRREAFVKGLRAAGYEVPEGGILRGAPGDVLVIWNRYGSNHETALQFERQGGRVIVAENGYVGNDRGDRRRYAIALEGHNGSGHWRLGGPERWKELGIELKDWRADGDHILVCPNRSFGMPGFIMPPNWSETIVERLKRVTKRPIRVRPHPGNDPAKKPLVEDLKGAWAVVIWSSSAGCEALIEGVPVFSDAPWWICSSATERDVATIGSPRCGPERTKAFENLAWAQWHVEEIERGEPFQYLLHGTSSFGGRV